jgi:hypothetical protein
MTKSTMLAIGIIIGASAGSLLSILTGDSYWLAVGPGIGVSLGLALGAGVDDPR